jgi:hypothetical protein
MQIIAAALPGGVLMFGLIVVVLGAATQPPAGTTLSLIAAVFAMAMLAAHVVVPTLVGRPTEPRRTEDDGAALCGVYQIRMIIGLALLEGAAFFNLVACLVEHNWWSLAIAGCLVVWMLALFPTRTRVEQWIENQRAFLG